ncbi:Retrotransposable element SLACS 132 kDa protein [Diplonema papillatum]|nr:Retrotransposable element SLACS 132 kDa protein [Diplonema papillatum]
MGRFSMGNAALVAEGLAEDNNTTWEALLSKHPKAAEHRRQEGPAGLEAGDPLSVPEDAVLSAIKEFPRGSGAGPSSLRAQFLKDAAGAPDNPGVVAEMTSFVNLLLAGKVPVEARPYLAGATLIALRKKDKPGDVRPIAVGEVWRRLTAKCACAKVKDQAREVLMEGNQVGVAVPGGAEAAVQVVREYARRMSRVKGKAMLKVDLRNAFNCVHREAFLREVEDRLPEIWPWVKWCYGGSSKLFTKGREISSEEGAQQGDPLGPLLFSLAIAPIIKQIKAETGVDLSLFYLDDGFFAGDSECILKAFKKFERACLKIGLKVARDKCEWIMLDESLSRDPQDWGFPKDTKMRKGDAFDFLGAPIGSDQHCAAFLGKKVEELKATFRMLRKMEDKQAAYCLLRACDSFGKMVYYMRAVPGTGVRKTFRKFDALVKDAMEDICELGFSDRSWKQAKLAIRLGGLGLRSTEEHHVSASIAALAGRRGLARTLDPAYEINGAQWGEAAAEFNRSIPHLKAEGGEAAVKVDPTPPEEVLVQRLLSRAVEEDQRLGLRGSYEDDINQARLNSITMPHASSWLTAIPWEGKDLPPAEFTTAVRLWVGAPVYKPGQTCQLCGERDMDQLGLHAMLCKNGGDMNTKHNAARDEVYLACADAALDPRKEEKHTVSGSTARIPGDVSLPRGVNERRPRWVDVTVMNPQAASYRKGAAKTVGYTARVGEELKHRKYAEDTKDNDRRLTAFAMESFGGMGAEARGFLLNVASLVAERTNQDKASTYRGYAERVSIRVVRGAAAAINRRGLVADRRTAGVDPSLTDPGMSGFIGPGCLDEVQRRVEDLHEEQELERAGAQTAKDGSTLSEVEEGGGESETASEVEEFPGDAPGQERGRTRSPSPPPAGVQVRAKGGCGGGGASDGRNEDEHMEGQSLDRAVMPPSGGHGAATHKGGPEESEIRGSQGHLYDALMRRDSSGLPEGAEPKTPGGDVDMEGPSQETEPAATSPNRGSARGPGPSGTTAPAAERTPAPEEPKPTPEEGLGHALDAPMRGCNRDSPVSLEPTAPGPAEDDAGTGWPGRESTSATHRAPSDHTRPTHPTGAETPATEQTPALTKPIIAGGTQGGEFPGPEREQSGATRHAELTPAFSKPNTAGGAPAGEWPITTTPPSQGAEATEGGQGDNHAGPTQGGGGGPPRGVEPGTPGPSEEVARPEGLDRGSAPAAATTPRERTLPPGPSDTETPAAERTPALDKPYTAGGTLREEVPCSRASGIETVRAQGPGQPTHPTGGPQPAEGSALHEVLTPARTIPNSAGGAPTRGERPHPPGLPATETPAAEQTPALDKPVTAGGALRKEAPSNGAPEVGPAREQGQVQPTHTISGHHPSEGATPHAVLPPAFTKPNTAGGGPTEGGERPPGDAPSRRATTAEDNDWLPGERAEDKRMEPGEYIARREEAAKREAADRAALWKKQSGRFARALEEDSLSSVSDDADSQAAADRRRRRKRAVAPRVPGAPRGTRAKRAKQKGVIEAPSPGADGGEGGAGRTSNQSCRPRANPSGEGARHAPPASAAADSTHNSQAWGWQENLSTTNSCYLQAALNLIAVTDMAQQVMVYQGCGTHEKGGLTAAVHRWVTGERSAAALLSVFANISGPFGDGRQCDLGEVLRTVATTVQEENAAHRACNTRQTDRIAGLGHRYTVDVRCGKCQAGHTAHEDLDTTILPVRAGTLQEGLDEAFSWSSAGEDYRCVSCGTRGESQTKPSFSRAGTTVLIQLQRARPFGGTDRRAVAADVAITLPGLGKRLRLVAVVTHTGENNAGHYIVHAHNEHAERGQRWTMLDGMNTSFSTAPRYEDTDTFLFAYQPTLEQPEALGDTRDAAPLGSASQDIPEAGEADNGNREGGGVGAQGATRPRHPQPEAPTGDPEVYPEHPGRSPSDAMRSPADTGAGPAEATASEGHSPVVTAPKATTQSTPQRTSETEGGHGPANSGTSDEGPSSEEYLARFEEATRRLAAGRAPQEGKLEAEAAGDDEKDSLSSESDEPNSLSTGPRTVTAARGMGVGDGQGGQAFHVTPPDTPRTPEPETAQESAARPGTSGPDGQAGDPGAELFPARGVPDMDAEEGIAFRLAGVRRKRDADSACDEGGEDEPPGPTRGITKKARGPKYAWDVVTPPELEDRFPISLHRKAGQGRVADEWGWAALNWLAVAHGRRRVPFAQLFRIQMWLAWERRRSSDFETPIDEQLALRGRCTAETLTVAARDLLGIILLRGKPPRKYPPGRWSALLGTLQDGEEGQWKYARAHPKGKGILFMDTEAGESRQDPAWHELDAVYTTLYAQVPLPLK